VTAGLLPASAPVVLRARGLRKRYGAVEAVRDVGFDIRSGEIYGLLGPTGAGKTSTLSMVCGLLGRDGGSVLLDDMPIDVGAVEARAVIGYVPQDPALYPDLTGRENLRFFGRAHGLSGPRLAARIDEVLELVGLAGRAGVRVETYSDGMQRRLSVAVGLLPDPRLLLLDEPLAGVDPQGREAMLDTIASLGRGAMAILYATRDPGDAEHLCHRIGIIAGGEIRAGGRPAELVAAMGGRVEVRLAATGDVAAAVAGLADVDGVVHVAQRRGQVGILMDDARAGMVARLVDATERAGAAVQAVEVLEPDLEALYLHVTGREPRDAAG
jgi:ABC-2 type transport system ATP-binding protein